MGSVARRRVIAREGSYLAPVAANGHRTPAATACARIIVKEQAALRIGAEPKTRAGAFGDNLGCRTGHGGKQPVKAALSSYKFDFPDVVLADEFVVPLGDTQNLVYGRDPFREHPLLADHGGEYFAQGSPEPPGLLEQGFRSLWVGLRKA